MDSAMNWMSNTTSTDMVQDVFATNDWSKTLKITGFVILLLRFAYKLAFSGPDLSAFPRAGKDPGFLGLGMTETKRDFYKNGPKILEEGYRKYKNKMFKVQTLNVERVVLSAKYIEEINKNAYESKLDMSEGLRERLMSSHTNLDAVFRSSLRVEVCKSQLTQNLHSLIEPINEEVNYWLDRRIPEEMEVTAYSTIVRIISATASRMIGGLEVSRNEEWLESAARYSGDVVQVAVKLRPYPSFVRYLIAPWLKGVRTLEEHLNTARVTFGPIFEKRFAIQQSGEKPDNYEKPVDMVQWMVESAQGIDKDSDVLARNILFMALAGVHTSSGTVIHALFDLCANPEHIEPLREEIEAMVGQHGWSLSALAGCKRLDSFMKESQRLNQTVLMTFNRKVTNKITFQDGTVLPVGTYITLPSDPIARDPDIYENPEVFDGMRFYEKRMASSQQANRHQFATTGPEALAFGQGKMACPGRFFAGSQIKILLANIILQYDVAFPDGQVERPKNIYKGGLVAPDRRQKLKFTPRHSVSKRG